VDTVPPRRRPSSGGSRDDDRAVRPTYFSIPRSDATLEDPFSVAIGVSARFFTD
jgi:hypothetical protein